MASHVWFPEAELAQAEVRGVPRPVRGWFEQRTGQLDRKFGRPLGSGMRSSPVMDL